ncbi:hypothetical protein EJB05_31795, partial [Eragrostis curvula]
MNLLMQLEWPPPPLGAAEDALFPVVCISALPDKLHQCVLTQLPLKETIRTSALALGRSDQWKSRWSHHSCVEIHLRSREDLQREFDPLPWPRRCHDFFSLIVDC